MAKYHVEFWGAAALVDGSVVIEADSLEEAERKYNSGEFEIEVESVEINEWPERVGVGCEPAPTLAEFYELIDESEVPE